MSAYLQALSCWVGQQQVFDKSSEALANLLHLKVSDKQVERLCHYYGEQLEEQQQQAIEQGDHYKFEADKKQELHYVMVDGAQFLFREQKWKEAKLGRIFPASAHMAESEKRRWIKDSIYVAHYGKHTGFTEKKEYYTDGLANMVIVADGAPWIWQWAEAMYPEQRQILDFYHAMEHLGSFAIRYFKEKDQAKAWIDVQKEMLLEDGIEEVMKAIRDLPLVSQVEVEKERKALLNYYQKNQKRMLYGSFRVEGLLIGSGPIEAAHRHVLQQRLKLSGQRWSTEGFQAVANLRALEKSQQWNQLIELTQKLAA